jgi:hypothetical protein
MIDLIDLEQDRLNDVVPDKFETRVADQMGDVGALAAEEVIKADNLVAIVQQAFAKMRAEKAGTAGYQSSHVFASVSRNVGSRPSQAKRCIGDYSCIAQLSLLVEGIVIILAS